MKKKLLTISLMAFSIFIGHAQKGHNWMSHLPDSEQLSRLTIPGTHDSGAIMTADGQIESNDTSVLALLPLYYIAQHHKIADQLAMGVRFLDLRMQSNINNEPTIVHGVIDFTTTFRTGVMDKVKNFLAANPKETIILSVKCDDGNSSELGDQLRTIMDSSTYKSLFYTGTTLPTLGQVRGKIVLLSRIKTLNRGIYIDVANNATSVASTNPYVKVQDYYNIGEDSCLTGNCDTNKDEKWDRIVKLMNESDATTNNNLYLNFSSAVMISTITGLPDIYNVATYINQRLKNHLHSKENKSYGVIIADYMESGLSKRIYMSNFGAFSPDTKSVLYEHKDYTGRFLRLYEGNHADFNDDEFNNLTSSVKVADGYETVLFWDYDYEAKYKVFSKNYSNIGITTFNDNASSAKVRKKVNVGVQLFKDYEYESELVGTYRDVSIGVGNYTGTTFELMAGGNNTLSSLIVHPGYKVTIYEDYNYGGSSKTFFEGSYPNFSDLGFNNTASSMKVSTNNLVVLKNADTSFDDSSNESVSDITPESDLTVKFKIFPNPAKENFTIEINNLEKDQSAELDIFGLNNKILLKQKIKLQKGTNKINIPVESSWTKSLCFVKLFLSNGKVVTQKVIIE